MDIDRQHSQWEDLEEEHWQFLQTNIQEVKAAHDLWKKARRAWSSEPGIELAWRQAEEIDAYQAAVQLYLGRDDEDLWEGGAEPEDDPIDRFAEHCAAGYYRGLLPNRCAREWRCQPG